MLSESHFTQWFLPCAPALAGQVGGAYKEAETQPSAQLRASHGLSQRVSPESRMGAKTEEKGNKRGLGDLL